MACLSQARCSGRSSEGEEAAAPCLSKLSVDQDRVLELFQEDTTEARKLSTLLNSSMMALLAPVRPGRPASALQHGKTGSLCPFLSYVLNEGLAAKVQGHRAVGDQPLHSLWKARLERGRVLVQQCAVLQEEVPESTPPTAAALQCHRTAATHHARGEQKLPLQLNLVSWRPTQQGLRMAPIPITPATQKGWKPKGSTMRTLSTSH